MKVSNRTILQFNLEQSQTSLKLALESKKAIIATKADLIGEIEKRLEYNSNFFIDNGHSYFDDLTDQETINFVQHCFEEEITGDALLQPLLQRYSMRKVASLLLDDSQYLAGCIDTLNQMDRDSAASWFSEIKDLSEQLEELEDEKASLELELDDLEDQLYDVELALDDEKERISQNLVLQFEQKPL